MFYGRVDVYWPDGPIESYRLNKATIAVGRSSGNDIVLDTTAISRYHITLTFQDQQVILEDLESVNGTYVDGTRLNPREPYPLRGGEEIQIGDIRLIFHPSAEALDAIPEGATTQRVEVSQPAYRVTLEGPDMAVAPGAHVQATLKIENLGEETGRYSIEVDGLPKGWVRIDRVEMAVDPGEQGQVMISFKPLRRSETQPGEYAVTLRVRSKANLTESIELPTMLQVLPYSGFGMALGRVRVEGDSGFRLYLHNQGNAALTLGLSGTDPAQMLRVRLPKNQVVLGPGERQTLTGVIEPRHRPIIGGEYETEFALLAQSHDPSGFLVSIPGTYVGRGLLPVWVPALLVPLIALIALLVVSVLLLVVGGNDEPITPPTITAFAVSTSDVRLGDMVEITWAVLDAESVSLVREQGGTQRQFDMMPDAVSYSMLFDQTGIHSVVLEARNGGELVTANAMITVRPLVAVSLDVLDADELTRNVQHTVRVTWNVSGAREFDGAYSIWMDSTDRVAPLVPAPLAPSGSQDIQIVLQDDQAEWLVTLYAEGADNVVANVTQKLPIVYPNCTLSVANTVVRSGPDEAYPALMPPLKNPVEGALVLSPVARDPGGEWLQVSIGADMVRLGWVWRDDFTCTNFDPDRLVITEDFPPPPEPSPEPSPAETPLSETPPAETPSPEDAPLPAAATPTPTPAS